MKRVASFEEVGSFLKPQLDADTKGREIVKDCLRGKIKSLREVDDLVGSDARVSETGHITFVKAMFKFQNWRNA